MQDVLTAYLALNNMVRNSRFEWDTKTAAERAARDAYITEAIAAVPQYKADIAYRMSQQDSAIGSFLDSFMSIGQLFEALSGTDGFRTVARDTLIRIANASPAILNAHKEINHTLVEAYLRLYKPAAYAKLPTNTAERHKALQRHLEGDYNAFIVDLQKPIHTGINLEHQLAPSVQAVRDAQGDTAPQDFGQELVLTKGEILNLILSGEQQEYQKNLIYHGYTEEVQSQLRAIIGSERLKKLRTGLDLLVNAAWGDTQLHGAFAKFCSFVQSGRAISLLSGNLGTLVRQLTALNWRYDAALCSNGKAMSDAGVQKNGKKMTNEKVVNHATKKGRRRVVFSLQCLRATGIEPVSHAWEARVLPLNDARALRGALYRCA